MASSNMHSVHMYTDVKLRYKNTALSELISEF